MFVSLKQWNQKSYKNLCLAFRYEHFSSYSSVLQPCFVATKTAIAVNTEKAQTMYVFEVCLGIFSPSSATLCLWCKSAVFHEWGTHEDALWYLGMLFPNIRIVFCPSVRLSFPIQNPIECNAILCSFFCSFFFVNNIALILPAAF